MARMVPADSDYFIETRVLGHRRHYRRGNPQELPAVQPPILPPPVRVNDLLGVYEDTNGALVYVYGSDDNSPVITVPVGSFMTLDPNSPDTMVFPNTPRLVP
jgi:hypothetical protein